MCTPFLGQQDESLKYLYPLWDMCWTSYYGSLLFVPLQVDNMEASDFDKKLGIGKEERAASRGQQQQQRQKKAVAETDGWGKL